MELRYLKILGLAMCMRLHPKKENVFLIDISVHFKSYNHNMASMLCINNQQQLAGIRLFTHWQMTHTTYWSWQP